METALLDLETADTTSHTPLRVLTSDFLISPNDKVDLSSSFSRNSHYESNWCVNILTIFEQKLTEDCATTDIRQLADSENKTILHHSACSDNLRKGLTVAYKVLAICRQNGWSEETFSKFVNVVDDDGFTALHYATKAKNKDLVVILFRHYADINMLNDATRVEVAKMVGDRIPKELIKLFNAHLSVCEDDIDPENEVMWNVQYDFGPLVGAYEKFHEALHQTKHLATWLRRTTARGTEDILLHPMTQIFILYKGRRYKTLRYISLFYHLLFYFAWAAVAYCGAANMNITVLEQRSAYLKSKLQPGNWPTEVEKKEYLRVSSILERTYLQRRYLICNAQQHLEIIPWLTICFILLNLLKEFVAFCLCVDKINYCKQWQNLFQWFLYIPYLGFLCKHSEELKTLYFIVSIFAAITLFQDQLSKSGILGIYNEIFAHGFKNVIKICFAFLPFLTAFTITFNLLLPMHQEYQLFDYSKIASMVVGELNYDAVFSPSGTASTAILYPGPAKVYFLVFAVAITLLFQNLVIAATISDVQKLRREARSIYLANRFEDIYHWENVIMHPLTQRVFGFFGWKRKLAKLLNVDRHHNSQRDSSGTRLDKYPLKLQNSLIKWYKKQNDRETTKL